MITVIEIEKRLEALREEWKGALAVRREIIKRQARFLQIAKERIEKKWEN